MRDTVPLSCLMEMRFSTLTPTGKGLTCIMNINIR